MVPQDTREIKKEAVFFEGAHPRIRRTLATRPPLGEAAPRPYAPATLGQIIATEIYMKDMFGICTRIRANNRRRAFFRMIPVAQKMA
jgi:hypothetical protein